MKNRGARGTTGKAKRREPLPDNDFKMAPDFRESLGRGQFLHYNMAAEGEHAVQQERELFSLSNRPFQSAKENGRAMCYVLQMFRERRQYKFLR